MDQSNSSENKQSRLSVKPAASEQVVSALSDRETLPAAGAGEIIRLLKEQAAKSEVILKEIEGVKRQIRWQKIWGGVRFLLIALPIILGLLYGLRYLPPEIKEAIEHYRSLLRS